MKKLLILAAVIAAPVLINGQSPKEAIDSARLERAEIIKRNRAERTESGQSRTSNGKQAAAAAVTDAEVGDSSSFNRNARFFGTVASGVVVIEADCAPVLPELGPEDKCVQVADPTVVTDVAFNNIGRITFPGKTADTIIYGIFNHNTSVFSRNGTGFNVSGLINYFPSVTIESDALNDPAAIDPSTGLPMAGSYTTSGIGSRTSQKTLTPGFFELDNLSYSRANTLGFSRSFWSVIGLPNSVIDELYKKPMTVKLNIRVRMRYVEFGTLAYSARFLAN